MQIVLRGNWLYGDSVPMPVDIVGLPYDFWFEVARADDALEPGEAPQPLDDAGLLYYVRFRNAGQTATPTWPDSPGYRSVAEALEAAEARLPTPVDWETAKPA